MSFQMKKKKKKKRANGLVAQPGEVGGALPSSAVWCCCRATDANSANPSQLPSSPTTPPRPCGFRQVSKSPDFHHNPSPPLHMKASRPPPFFPPLQSMCYMRVNKNDVTHQPLANFFFYRVHQFQVSQTKNSYGKN